MMKPAAAMNTTHKLLPTHITTSARRFGRNDRAPPTIPGRDAPNHLPKCRST